MFQKLIESLARFLVIQKIKKEHRMKRYRRDMIGIWGKPAPSELAGRGQDRRAICDQL